MVRFRSLCSVVIASMALLAPGTLLAAPEPTPRFLVPGEGANLHPGNVVTVRWTPLPSDTTEFELLLLIDDTSDATVRLTVQLDPTRCSYTWRVPNLPSSSARLRIRLSRGAGEEDGPISAPFRILPSEGVDLAGFAFHGGEWWVTRLWASPLAPILPTGTRWHELPAAPWPLEPLGSQGEQDQGVAHLAETDEFQTAHASPGPRREDPYPFHRQPSSIPQRE